VLATGPARARLVEALLEAARRGPPNIPPLPEVFQHFRRELGAEVYGSMESLARIRRAGRLPYLSILRFSSTQKSVVGRANEKELP
jgi:hypothetical protein